jgi:Xaa-Pro aminopeptidase
MNVEKVNELLRTEFPERRANLRRRLGDREFEGTLVISRGANGADWGADILYLTNHYSPFPQIPDRPPAWSGRGLASLVMPATEDGTLVVDIPDWRDDLVVMEDVRVGLDLWAETVSVLKDRGLASGKVALIGRESTPFIAVDRIRQELPNIELVWADEIIEDMRVRKSEAEVELMRRSTAVGCDMVNAFMEAAVPGATEADCVIAAFAAGVREGAFPLDIPVTSGPNVDHFQWDRMPSWDHQRTLNEGDMIHPDMYGTVNGYFYDLVRTTVAGRKVSDGQREVLEASIGVVEHIISGMTPSTSCEELFQRGAEWLKDHGFDAPGAESAESVAYLGQSFPAFGHSIGLAWEHPWLMPGEKAVLEAGMVFAVEAEVGRPGAGTGAFEHDVLVTSNGAEVLTIAAKNVWWE